MAPLTPHAAAELSPEQAAALARVLDLQAGWENHRHDAAAGDAHGPGLRERQRRYEAYRAALAGYSARHRAVDLPELNLSTPERVAGWCRVVRAVCRQAGPQADAPAQVAEKAYRLADRIAARLGVAPADRDDRAEGMGGVIAGLDAVVAWCDGRAGGRVAPRPEPAPTPVGEPIPMTAHDPVPVSAGWRAA
ncbi:hypothetical protein [Urbifossiella limnaea]|uniref:Uncharacterized protein n=1 Tax=Urbifossiella limnaea TaxID=2528023 RepID=A0A517XNH1_9BACT|nr:hypothetical protein [Urbifossiella limnaea]QDU19055.1 hypothetical protein ETAA1_09580 [Urbifossiella limnaea]